MDDFLSQTELGEIYGVTSHKIGKWLRGLGLRDENGKPTARAFQEGFVKQRPSTQPGTYFYVWHKAKTTEQLDGMCYPRAK
jgi:hypothetical protein